MEGEGHSQNNKFQVGVSIRDGKNWVILNQNI